MMRQIHCHLDRLLCATAAVLLLSAVPRPLAAAPQPPSYEVSVVTVEVPVYVTERDGEPRRGLTADDFEIYDRGRKQQVLGLETVDLAQLDVRAAALSERRLAATGRRHFLLLFDFSFSNPVTIVRAREAARKMVLEQLGPTDLAAIGTFSLDRGPRILVTFTPDRAQLVRAIDTLGARPMLGREVADPLGFLIESPDRASASASSERAGTGTTLERNGLAGEYQQLIAVLQKQMEKGQKAFDRSRISSWARSMSDLAGMLAAVSGRKQLVYFSEGFDSRLLFGRQPGVDQDQIQADDARVVSGASWMVDSDDVYGNTGAQSKVQAMLQAFRRADCVIHAVDIGGLRADADVRSALGNRGQESLFFIANETGGHLIEDANDLGARLDSLLRGSRVTYLLSFQPQPLEPDGSYHRLEVKLRNAAGAAVSHREGYFAPRPFAELPPLERTLLAAEAIASPVPRKDLELHVLAAPFRAGAGAYVPVIIEAGSATLLGDEKRSALDLEIYVYVTDQRGEMRDFFTQMVHLDISEEGRAAMLASGLKYYGHLSLGTGKYLIRVLVRDSRDGRSGVAAVPLEVPAYDRQEAVLLPPLFVDGGRWVMVKEHDGNQGETVVYPFVVKGTPFVPAARAVLQRQTAVDVMLVGYNLPAGPLELRSSIRSADGTAISGSELSLVERTATGIGGVDKMVARFDPGTLPPGDYALEVSIGGAAGAPHEAVSFTVVD